jgi:predicted amidohydrolase YtcJ
MLEPYAGEPDNRGIAVRTTENLRDLIRTAAQHGIASCIHAIGDAANRLLLDILTRRGPTGSARGCATGSSTRNC